MKSTNVAKSKHLSQYKTHNKKCPNPTNFSNSRTHQYLGASNYTSENENVAPKPNMAKHNGKIASDLSKLGLPTPFSKSKPGSIELPSEESKSIGSNQTPQKIVGNFPQTTKAMAGIDKIFWTERPPAKGDFGPVRIHRLEKLQPKLLPISNESIIESALFASNADNGNENPGQNNNDNSKSKEVKIGICLYENDEEKNSSDNKNKYPPEEKVGPFIKKSPKEAIKVDTKNKGKGRSRSEQRKSGGSEKDQVFFDYINSHEKGICDNEDRNGKIIEWNFGVHN